MIHVFVESNWVVDVCAPAFRRSGPALDLLDRARRAEIALHVPSIAFPRARLAAVYEAAGLEVRTTFELA